MKDVPVAFSMCHIREPSHGAPGRHIGSGLWTKASGVSIRTPGPRCVTLLRSAWLTPTFCFDPFQLRTNFSTPARKGSAGGGSEVVMWFSDGRSARNRARSTPLGRGESLAEPMRKIGFQYYACDRQNAGDGPKVTGHGRVIDLGP